jgi:hypothetical protein
MLLPHANCSLALSELPSALSSLSLMLPDAPQFVVSFPTLVISTLWLVISTPRCSPGYHQTSYIYLDFLPVLPGAPEYHCISPAHTRIWPPWDSGPITSRHSQRPPQTKIHSTFNLASTIIIRRTYRIGWHGSMFRDDLWNCLRNCKPFFKCVLWHSQNWVHWSWPLNTASQ